MPLPEIRRFGILSWIHSDQRAHMEVQSSHDRCKNNKQWVSRWVDLVATGDRNNAIILGRPDRATHPTAQF